MAELLRPIDQTLPVWYLIPLLTMAMGFGLTVMTWLDRWKARKWGEGR